ncbi:MAG: sigma-70 family RNA polymerase sigma factor [Acidobacteria bacterium]|nr:sigma-70 family RNA polymerase sigma factor [Acidobacteriota bacterium]
MPSEVAGIACMTDKLPPGSTFEDQQAALSEHIERARAGETIAFEQLMVCTQHKVTATAWRVLGNREDARDATQEVFLRAFKYLKTYRAGQDFHGWLYRITVNVCRDMLRGRGVNQAQTSTADAGREQSMIEALPGEADTAESAVLAQQRAIVGRAIETLPEKERTALVLRDLEGLSTEEVARVMGSRPATVRSQVSTARSKVKVFCERFLREKRQGGGGL